MSIRLTGTWTFTTYLSIDKCISHIKTFKSFVTVALLNFEDQHICYDSVPMYIVLS